MDWKKIITRGLIIALAIVAIAFIAGAGNYIVTFFVPPRIYYVIGAIIIVILLKILNELRNRRGDDDE